MTESWMLVTTRGPRHGTCYWGLPIGEPCWYKNYWRMGGGRGGWRRKILRGKIWEESVEGLVGWCRVWLSSCEVWMEDVGGGWIRRIRRIRRDWKRHNSELHKFVAVFVLDWQWECLICSECEYLHKVMHGGKVFLKRAERSCAYCACCTKFLGT